MALDRILLSHFRNHGSSALDNTRAFNLLIGDNGAGKTNVLEAISLMAPGRGLRRSSLMEMAGQQGPGGFAVSAQLSGGALGGTVQIGTATLPHQPSRRIVQINQAEASAVRLGEWLSLGWLTPAMDRLFMDSAGARRRWLDRMVLGFAPKHAQNASRLETALRERNRLLAESQAPDPTWLDALEAQIAEAGSAVAGARADLINWLQIRLADLPEQPFARPVLAYLPGGPVEESELRAALRVVRPRDMAAQRTLVGPHRDEVQVTMAGKEQAAALCSTGEQKAMLIAITLAHAALLDEQDDRPRLLLLDEVAAHLDPLRRAALFDRLRQGRAQVWFTGTELGPFADIVAEAAVWRVNEGRLIPGPE